MMRMVNMKIKGIVITLNDEYENKDNDSTVNCSILGRVRCIISSFMFLQNITIKKIKRYGYKNII